MLGEFMWLMGVFLLGTQLAEFSGYFWHRRVCHLGLLHWLPNDFLRRRHAGHHEEKYPPGGNLQTQSYLDSCEIAFKILGTVITVILLVALLVGWISITNLIVLYLGTYFYAQYVMNPLHKLYHLTDDQVRQYKVFQYNVAWKLFCWLRTCHDKHHFANCNYFILNPLPDILFGTFVSSNKTASVEDIFPGFDPLLISDCEKRVFRK